ncbi:MAG: hypothetical protein SWK76_02205 [Actinomycetota bacterium]|nr:hypothetical protein [Actinomycetota bacterium]
MYPEIQSEELRDRVDTFILRADVNSLFDMQEGLFDFATPYFLADERISTIMRGLDGRRIGLAIGREYESTIIFGAEGFEMIWGITRGYPILQVLSREAYRDGILRLVDPLRLVVTRKVRIKRLTSLALMALPFWHILIDDTLYEKFLSYQVEVEQWILEELERQGY